jgi:hypothetical protein
MLPASVIRERHNTRGFALEMRQQREGAGSMNYLFWLIGVIVVVIAVLSFLGLR